MELSFLHLLQSMQTEWLDRVMIFITRLGDAGIIWLLLGIILVCIKKTRPCGIGILASMAVCFLIGNVFLKNLVARARPYETVEGLSLLVRTPKDFSFPSGHTMHSFTAATSIFLWNKKAGAAALVLACLIAFSRMYLFVHFPSDILAGIIIGTFVAYYVFKNSNKKLQIK